MKRKQLWQLANNYALYYGAGQSERLSGYDVAVVEPAGQTADGLRQLRQAGTLVFAYVSIVEIASYHAQFGLLRESDFLRLDGKPLTNETFGTYMLDLMSERWRGLLHHHIGRLLLGDGYDGLFLDTIGNVEMHALPHALRERQLSAAADLVHHLKRWFPEHLLIQNNGLERLCLHTADAIDGICWENPPFHRPESTEWVDAITARLQEMAERKGLKVFLLLEEGQAEWEKREKAARALSERHRFLLYRAPVNYVQMGLNQ